MKKIILILLGIFIYNFLFAQESFYKKRKWGVNFGLNYYYPVIDGYSYYSCPYLSWNPSIEDYCITLTGSVGKYLGISRTMELCKINEKNSLNLLIGLSYNERKATLKYSGTKTVGGILNYVNETEKKRDKYLCLDIKLTSIANLKEKYGIYNAVGFKTNTSINERRYFRDELYDSDTYFEHCLTYSLGFLFYLKKINIMFYIDHSIFNFFNLRRFDNPIIIHYPSFLDMSNEKFFNLTNFGISIFFNEPLKNKKNEEK